MPRLNIPVSPGLTSRYITLDGVKIHVLEHGAPSAPEKIMMVHGNVAAASWWEECMLALDPEKYHSVAIDLRGFGMSDPAPVDATRGVRNFSDDTFAVVKNLGWTSHHLWGHSMGTGVAYQYMLDHIDHIKSVVLIAAISPFGLGGTKGVEGVPCYPDYEGSGGGLWVGRKELIRLMSENYREDDLPEAPLKSFRTRIVKPPFIHPREDVLLTVYNASALGEDNLPGNWEPSANWPYVAPGDKGVLNAMSPKYFDVSAVSELGVKPPILWVRGEDDVMIGNAALSDIALYGKMGIVPNWPGDDVFPHQPMIDQIRHMLDKYGNYQEVVFEDCGHSPQAEKFDEFMPLVIQFMDKIS